MTPQTAVELMLDGYSCTEGFLMAYAPVFNIESETAAKLATGFAGGLAQGKTCGAVTVAVMLIGLKYGPGMTRDLYKKDLCMTLTQEFCRRFRQKRQSTRCSTLLTQNGINPADPSQRKYLRERRICNKIVKDAAVILDEIFRDAKH